MSLSFCASEYDQSKSTSHIWRYLLMTHIHISLSTPAMDESSSKSVVLAASIVRALFQHKLLNVHHILHCGDTARPNCDALDIYSNVSRLSFIHPRSVLKPWEATTNPWTCHRYSSKSHLASNIKLFRASSTTNRRPFCLRMREASQYVLTTLVPMSFARHEQYA